MVARIVTPSLSVSEQVRPDEVPGLAKAGFRALICNRPDGEGVDQPAFVEIEAAARAAGMEAAYLPIVSGIVTDADAKAFGALLDHLPRPVLAYCRSGTRSATLWSLSEGGRGRPLTEILSAARGAGFDMAGVVRRIANGGRTPTDQVDAAHEVVIIGGGAAGIAVAASLKARQPDLDIAIIDPSDIHYDQPGWTMVGAGIQPPGRSARTMWSQVPPGVRWIRAAVAAFEPAKNVIILDGCRVVHYAQLVVAPGLKLDWAGVEGLTETLGRNGVTSNYRYDLAPYTWELVSAMTGGRAVFTQPPVPIKCAGAPQKAMYLSADHWLRSGRLADIRIDYFSAGTVLFGVRDYVPALMDYIGKYDAQLHFRHRLTRVDGPAKTAWFARSLSDGTTETVETEFDMIHVVPPQVAPDFVRVSPLADAAGWVDVDQATLRHRTLPDIYSLGDVCNAPNTKTAAAAQRQAPVVAHNLLLDRGAITGGDVAYDGYGACPLTVERGRIVLAEFGFGGKLMPSYPHWLIDGTRPSRLAWMLNDQILPPLCRDTLQRGRAWMHRPLPVTAG